MEIVTLNREAYDILLADIKQLKEENELLKEQLKMIDRNRRKIHSALNGYK